MHVSNKFFYVFFFTGSLPNRLPLGLHKKHMNQLKLEVASEEVRTIVIIRI